MMNLHLTLRGGSNVRPTMKRRSVCQRTFYHLTLLCLLTLPLNRCDSADNVRQAQPEMPDIPRVTPHIIRTIPHDTLAFTQGLLFHDDKMYESTGHQGRSTLRCIRVEDGAILKKMPVPRIFAEGLVLKNNRLIQLTWQSGRALIYSLPELKKNAEMNYSGEGWGITTDGTLFIMSNGSDTLYWRDNSFNIKRKRAVTLRSQPLTRLNELEFAGNFIYANVWYSDYIFEIAPQSGKVNRIIDCSSLVKQVGTLNEEDVLNGIAYDREQDLFYITGKNWPLIFEVKIPG